MSKSWKRRIEEARPRGEFTESDRGRIGPYATCMVSELKGITCIGSGDTPKDHILQKLAISAVDAVWQDDVDLAQEIHAKIHERAKEVRKANRVARQGATP